MTTPRVAIDAIVIGKRTRHESGDIEALAESIRKVGLLHPPVINGEDRLICGFRRIQAMRLLGWTETPVTFAANASDEMTALLAERDENTCRKDLLPSEAWAEGKQFFELEARLAKERQQAATVRGNKSRIEPSSANFAELGNEPRSANETRARVAKVVGVSHTSLKKVGEVIRAAESDPNPVVRATAKKAATEMDATGKIDPAFRKVNQARVRVQQAADDEKEEQLLDQALADRGIARVTDPDEIAATRLKHQTLGAFGVAVDGLARMAVKYPPETIRTYHDARTWPEYRELACKAIDYLKECL